MIRRLGESRKGHTGICSANCLQLPLSLTTKRSNLPVEVKGYKLFSQIIGGLLFISGLIAIALSWPPGDFQAWLFMLLGAVGLRIGKTEERMKHPLL
jgi:uncharacterized membrane protein